MALNFWFEFASTYSYPAAMRVEKAAADAGVQLVWKPFLLGPIFNAQGWNNSPFNIYPAKGAYMWRDLERICAAQNLPLRKSSEFPRNGLMAARIAVSNADAPWLPKFARAIYAANFADDRNIAEPAVIADCLRAAGQDAPAIIGAAQSQTAKDKLRAQTDEAARLGIFGAPTFMVGGEMFWGNDRLDAALDWHRKHQP